MLCVWLVLQTKQQIKRLRRQQSNRESARRSRQRKAEEANMLAQRLGEMEVHFGTLQAKNNALMGELQQLRTIVDTIANDTSALATQVSSLAGKSRNATTASTPCSWNGGVEV